jgi:hypothetical protein
MSMRIPVQGTFDVALARNMLRKKVAERGWLPSFRARAAAALTTLTELVLLSQTPAVLNLNMVDPGGPNVGIELICEIHWHASREEWLEQARTKLTRAANEMEIKEQGAATLIIARIWLSEDEKQWIK